MERSRYYILSILDKYSRVWKFSCLAIVEDIYKFHLGSVIQNLEENWFGPILHQGRTKENLYFKCGKGTTRPGNGNRNIMTLTVRAYLPV